MAPQGDPVLQPAPIEAGQFVAGVVLEAAGEVGNLAAPVPENVKESNAEIIGTSSAHLNIIPNLIQIAAATAPKLKSVIVGPSAAYDPMVPVIPSLIKQVSNFIAFNPSSSFLKHLSILNINHDTLVPSYFSDRNLLSTLPLSYVLSLVDTPWKASSGLP